MKKKVAVIHTSLVSLETLKQLFQELIPQADMMNLIDDTLLPEVIAAGHLTKSVTRRFCTYAVTAEQMGADLLFSQCSSVGEAVDVARNLVAIPILKIDEPMAEQAVAAGGVISVLATVSTTLAPSLRLLERTAAAQGKAVDIRPCLVEGAFEVLIQGDKERHNQMVLEQINQVASKSDVIVLAQGSMVALLPHLKHIRIPVLSSPRSGVIRIGEKLGLL